MSSGLDAMSHTFLSEKCMVYALTSVGPLLGKCFSADVVTREACMGTYRAIRLLPAWQEHNRQSTMRLFLSGPISYNEDLSKQLNVSELYVEFNELIMQQVFHDIINTKNSKSKKCSNMDVSHWFHCSHGPLAGLIIHLHPHPHKLIKGSHWKIRSP